MVLSGAAKGVAYNLFEQLGAVRSADMAHMTRSLEEQDKAAMARLGLRFGVEAVYLPDMLKPAQIELRGLLWNLYLNDTGTFFAPPAPGRVTIDAVENVPDAFWLAVGYRRLGGRVMRVDMVERVAMLVRTAARDGAFKITEEMLSLAGATREQMAAMLLDMQCKLVGEEPSEDPEKPAIQIFERVRRTRPKNNQGNKNNSQNNAAKGDKSRPDRRKHAGGKSAGGRQADRNAGGRPQAGQKSRGAKPTEKQPDPNSPFAVLAGLKLKD